MSPDEMFSPDLLDLHLGRLSEVERVALQARIAADPQLAQQDEGLSTVFQALGNLRADPAPTDLKARISARVVAAASPPRIVRPADELTDTVADRDVRVLRLGNLREIVSVAAMIVLMVGFGVPSLLNMRERSQRMGCSSNLRMLGQGLQQYAGTFNASLPFAGWNSRTIWRPSDDPSMEMRPNRQHVYPLLRCAYVQDPRVFVCPSRGGVPMPRDQVARFCDFLDSRNVSYAYFNMAGVRPSSQDNPNLPIMADDNPLFQGGVPLFERLGFGGRARGNSSAHGGAGQNILTLDGRVKWATTPCVGIDCDNIWTLDGVETYTGREGPASPTDAHLLK